MSYCLHKIQAASLAGAPAAVDSKERIWKREMVKIWGENYQPESALRVSDGIKYEELRDAPSAKDRVETAEELRLNYPNRFAKPEENGPLVCSPSIWGECTKVGDVCGLGGQEQGICVRKLHCVKDDKNGLRVLGECGARRLGGETCRIWTIGFSTGVCDLLKPKP